MNELFTENIGLKVISLFSAILLWFIVINVENPVSTKDFPGIEVQVKNQQEITSRRKSINFLEGRTVSVTVRGKRIGLDKLKASDIKAVADIELINEYGAIEIQVIVPDGFTVVRKTPSHMKVELEDVVTVQKSISYDLVGEAAEGYVVRGGVIKPTNSISLTGPKSQIAKIDSVRVKVDVADKKQDILIYVEPIAYDQYGEEILGLEKSVDQVEVYVPIKKLKVVPVEIAPWDAAPPDGYVIMDARVDPAQITLIGEEKEIDQIDKILLPGLDLSNITTTTVFTQNLRALLPSGIEIFESEDQAKVTVELKREILREYQIPIDEVNVQKLPEELQFRFVTRDPIPITLVGLESDIYKLQPHSIRASIDLSGYEKGIHTIELSLILPKGIRIVGEGPEITVELIEAQEEVTEEVTTE
ncbi:MAG: hypothetical protein GX962_15035 [Epulopiscium sp.]|nr:hypothetical protein [Candidatus Epulonipiscium sp.]